MAKDPTDYNTVDFISPVMNVACGQVLVSRKRLIAIVAKKGRVYAHLVHLKSGTVKLVKYTAGELVEEWSDTDCNFDRALANLLQLGKRYGISGAAEHALEDLIDTRRKPKQHKLF
jgi:hypothetical protein